MFVCLKQDQLEISEGECFLILEVFGEGDCYRVCVENA